MQSTSECRAGEISQAKVSPEFYSFLGDFEVHKNPPFKQGRIQ